MNILFFLTPKTDVSFINSSYTLKQAVEKMEQQKFSAIPIIDEEGKYCGVITEGDILWYIKEHTKGCFSDCMSANIMEVPRRFSFEPVKTETNIEDLVFSAMNQPFIPVVDDREILIGIITRRELIKYLYQTYAQKKA